MGFAPAQGTQSRPYQTVVIFVDGHSLRYALGKVIAGFDAEKSPLPKDGKWRGLFEFLATSAAPIPFLTALLRTYWYVPGGVTACNEERRPDEQNRERRVQVVEEQEEIRKTHREITLAAGSLEFVYSGTRKYKFDKEPQNAWADEKGVDITMAVDMLRKAPLYDVAVVVTRDADFVPAIRAIKDLGKTVVVPKFTDPEGQLVVETADDLLLAADFTFNIETLRLRGLIPAR